MSDQIELCRMRHASVPDRQWRLMRDPTTGKAFIEDISDRALARDLPWLITFEFAAETAPFGLCYETVFANRHGVPVPDGAAGREAALAMTVLKGCVDRYLAKTSVSVFVVEIEHAYEGCKALAVLTTFERAKRYCEEDPVGAYMHITEMAPVPVRFWKRSVGYYGDCADRGFDPDNEWTLEELAP